MMTRTTFLVATLAVALLAGSGSSTRGAEGKDARALIAKVVQEAGGRDALKAKKDVEYTYVYRNGASGKLDVSLERYVFDGEKSWARYYLHENTSPNADGPVVQGYDGRTTWQTVGGTLTTDEQSLRRADFLRKTNFYWFAMTFKLLDPGLRYTYEGIRKVAGTSYELVKVTFDEGVGDVSDTYVLYINPRTWRIDRFLFTVLDFGKTEPFLMTVQYERVDGVLLPLERRYAKASWSGQLVEQPQWTDEISVGARFNNGFSGGLFERP